MRRANCSSSARLRVGPARSKHSVNTDCMADKFWQGLKALLVLNPRRRKLPTLICPRPTLKLRPSRNNWWAVASASSRLLGWRRNAPPTTPMAQGLKALSTETSACAVVGWTSGAQAIASERNVDASMSEVLSTRLWWNASSECWREVDGSWSSPRFDVVREVAVLAVSLNTVRSM